MVVPGAASPEVPPWARQVRSGWPTGRRHRPAGRQPWSRPARRRRGEQASEGRSWPFRTAFMRRLSRGRTSSSWTRRTATGPASAARPDVTAITTAGPALIEPPVPRRTRPAEPLSHRSFSDGSGARDRPGSAGARRSASGCSFRDGRRRTRRAVHATADQLPSPRLISPIESRPQNASTADDGGAVESRGKMSPPRSMKSGTLVS